MLQNNKYLNNKKQPDNKTQVLSQVYSSKGQVKNIIQYIHALPPAVYIIPGVVPQEYNRVFQVHKCSIWITAQRRPTG